MLRPLLELESASNDPMAVFLTIGAITLLLNPNLSPLILIPLFIQQMAVGGLIGYGMGKVMVYLINRLKLEFEGLYPVLTLALVMMTYGVTASLGGSGFLAAYIAGLVLGNSMFIHKNSLMRFHEGIAWLMQIAMFLTLGLLVFPSHLIPVISSGILLSLFLIFVARPVTVFLTLSPWKIALRDKVMVSWVGLRGAAPIVLATFPLLAGIPQAETIFNLVFFLVITSALLHGTSIPFVASHLGVSDPLPELPRLSMSLGDGCTSGNDLIELTVPIQSRVAGKQIVDIGLPSGTLIIMIEKGGNRFVPCGSTVLEGGDHLLVLTNQPQSDQVRSIFISEPSAENPGP